MVYVVFHIICNDMLIYINKIFDVFILLMDIFNDVLVINYFTLHALHKCSLSLL